MNTVKKVISLITIAVIVIRVFAFNTFALAGAPVIAAEELTALLETALIGSGLYTESELEGKDYLELNNLLKDGIGSGQINPKTNYYTDPISKVQYNLLDLLTKPEVQAGIGIINGTVSAVVDNVVSDFFSDYEKLRDSVVMTPAVDLNGNGCLAVLKGENSYYNYVRYVYGDYGIVNSKPNGKNAWERLRVTSNDNPACYVVDYLYNKDGSLFRVDEFFIDNHLDSVDSGKLGFFVDNFTSVNYYGDWKYADDTPAETDDVLIPVIGEADGTQVTPDMLNPDGTVTIDGVTYYPNDFIDWDKFKDPVITDLLNQILDILENVPVIEQDKPIVDTDSIDVDVPEELNDFAVPVGIANVFPFSLPWDFSRGIKMLLAEPEVPVFKTELDLTDFCGFDLGKIPIEISLEDWEPAVKIVRWFFLLQFVVMLVFLTSKIVKGGGS